MIAAQFLRNLVAAVPHTIHTVLTDNSIQFANHAHHKYAFDRVCDEYSIEYRLTKVNHPWTNRQVERMTGRSKKRPSSAITTIATTSFDSTPATLSSYTTTAAGSRPSKGSRPTKPSAKHGRTSQTASHQARTIKSWIKHLGCCVAGRCCSDRATPRSASWPRRGCNDHPLAGRPRWVSWSFAVRLAEV